MKNAAWYNQDMKFKKTRDKRLYRIGLTDGYVRKNSNQWELRHLGVTISRHWTRKAAGHAWLQRPIEKVTIEKAMPPKKRSSKRVEGEFDFMDALRTL